MDVIGQISKEDPHMSISITTAGTYMWTGFKKESSGFHWECKIIHQTGCMIESTWRCVLQFIKQYMLNKDKNVQECDATGDQ